MRVAILGFGLIGGSIARALRAGPDSAAWDVVAWSPSGTGPAKAHAEGVIGAAATSPTRAVKGAELILLAAPPLETLALLRDLAGPMSGARRSDATITDVASTKSAIVQAANELALPFVGGHPMAGRETAGYEAATADLFQGRPWVVVPGAHAGSGDVEMIEELARAVGAVPQRMSADVHDAAVAGISHLPLVLAAALTEAVAATADWPETSVLAASGWRDMTRLARGDVAMGSGIAATNAAAIAARIRRVQDVLDAWLADLDGRGTPDVDALRARLQTAQDRLGTADDA
jgi:prephenate dehydrogenase